MIDDELLAEIQKACADAKFGYGSVTIHTYYKHVSALLGERKVLLDKFEAGVIPAAPAPAQKGKK